MYLRINKNKNEKKISTLYDVFYINLDETNKILKICTLSNDFIIDFMNNTFSDKYGVDLGEINYIVLGVEKTKQYFYDYTQSELEDFMNNL